MPELKKHRPQARIALISKTSLNESNSFYAQGGIATVFSQEDSIDRHIADTVAAGDGLGNHEAIQTILPAGQQLIQDLQDYGVAFDKNVTGQSDLAREGGHSQRRIFHCGDHTGRR